jgi:outer membrane protein assembly factor BamD (BamD/ComL family)
MNMPLSSTACDALQAMFVKRRDDTSASNLPAARAFSEAITLLQEARMAEAKRDLAALQRKLSR